MKAVKSFEIQNIASYFQVMPELREWCEKYRIHLIECDLRWGVPKNTDSIETIQICLDEIDKCIKETNGQPFFLNLLGERYSSVSKGTILLKLNEVRKLTLKLHQCRFENLPISSPSYENNMPTISY